MRDRKELITLILKLTLFAAAFGYIEGSVAHYLRLIYYPEGFSFPLKTMDPHTLMVEMGRELATLIVLTVTAFLTKGSPVVRFSRFVYLFGVWDIAYYGALFLFESWPRSLFDWDILFLIPAPWASPVLAPITISFVGIMGAILIEIIYYLKGNIKAGVWISLSLAAALTLWLISFMTFPHKAPVLSSYRWDLFLEGIVLAVAGYSLLIIKTFRKESKGGRL